MPSMPISSIGGEPVFELPWQLGSMMSASDQNRKDVPKGLLWFANSILCLCCKFKPLDGSIF